MRTLTIFLMALAVFLMVGVLNGADFPPFPEKTVDVSSLPEPLKTFASHEYWQGSWGTFKAPLKLETRIMLIDYDKEKGLVGVAHAYGEGKSGRVENVSGKIEDGKAILRDGKGKGSDLTLDFGKIEKGKIEGTMIGEGSLGVLEATFYPKKK